MASLQNNHSLYNFLYKNKTKKSNSKENFHFQLQLVTPTNQRHNNNLLGSERSRPISIFFLKQYFILAFLFNLLCMYNCTYICAHVYAVCDITSHSIVSHPISVSINCVTSVNRHVTVLILNSPSFFDFFFVFGFLFF